MKHYRITYHLGSNNYHTATIKAKSLRDAKSKAHAYKLEKHLPAYPQILIQEAR